MHLLIARSSVLSLFLLSCALPLAVCHGAHAQTPPRASADDLKPTELAEHGEIESVVLYRGRAAVTRTIRRSLGQGLWAVKIGNLPATAQAQSLQAKVARGGDSTVASQPKLLSVEYSQTALAEFAGSPEGVALADKLKELRQKLEYLKQDDQQEEQQAKLVDQIGVRAAANATNDGGTQALNLDAARAQLEFVAKERARIVAARRAIVTQSEELQRQLQATQREFDARGGADRTERAAVVVIAMPEGGPVELSLTYVVAQATWEPIYNIRAAGDRTGVEVEYDAMITQATGEDWKDVRLALSTAQPTRASAPPPVSPWFVDVFVPIPAAPASMAPGSAGMSKRRDQGDKAMAGEPMMDANAGFAVETADRRLGIELTSASASVQETGTAVSFDLPRRLTVPTDTSKKQRTRIASLAPTSNFVYTAQPIVTEDVFLRGDLTNSSAFQLLPGMAQVFMGGDFIGETTMPSVAPKDEFKVFFGPDRSLRATRQLVNKTTGSSGFFGGSQSTTWSYRIAIDNSTGRAANVELFDRSPVSRNEKISVTVSKLSSPLSTSKQYAETLQTQGIMRWDLSVPASSRGDAAMPVTWTVEVSRPNAVQTTPLPPD